MASGFSRRPASMCEGLQLDELKKLTRAVEGASSKLDAMTEARRDARPFRIDEHESAPDETTLTLSPERRGLVVVQVDTVCAYVSSTGTLTIGDRVIPLSTGLTVINKAGWLLRSNDTRQITQQSAGALYLEITGEELPTQGIR